MTTPQTERELPALPTPWQCETRICPALYTADQVRDYARAAIELTRPAAPDALTASEAVTAFGAWLTCRAGTFEVGASHHAGPMAAACAAFNSSQGFASPRDHYHTLTKPYPSLPLPGRESPTQTDTAAPDAVRGLVEKWRKEAADLNAQFTDDIAEAQMWSIRRRADELESALAAPAVDGGECESLLDRKAGSVSERLWLVSNKDGTREICLDVEKAGRGGFAPAWGQSYRAILNEFVRSLEKDALLWLEFYQEMARGVHQTKGPVGGTAMPAIAVVANGKAYTVYIGTQHKGRFLGFGGARAKITMTDGTVHESNNVWFGRDVPPALRNVLADTASIQWES